MCGLTGLWSPHLPEQLDIGKKMAEVLHHRGPDDTGVWCDELNGLALAHKRLSILDLSMAGHQPMHSPCQRYTVVFNGEIYNHWQLRKELDSASHDIKWRGSSDTETLIAAIAKWGLKKTLQKLNGMFAFAVWDKANRELSLARDRVGEKPLYYGHSGKSFLFGSELKALRQHPDWNGEIDRNVLALYLRHNYVPAPWSIYTGIFKLPPAHYVTVSESGQHISEVKPYWKLPEFEKMTGSKEQLADQLDTLIGDAVEMRMLSDVPLGAFLSGGIDSSMVVAQMQARSSQPIKTFSIGFCEDEFNEAVYAEKIARHLGTDHHELYVNSEQALEVIPQLSAIYDEPFSDSSQIPTFLVSKLAKQHVSVSLSGDGGDELFYGYSRYQLATNIWGKIQCFPRPIRKGIANLCMSASRDVLIKLNRKIRSGYINKWADRLPKIADLIKHETEESFYRHLVSHWKDPDKVVLNANEADSVFARFNSPGESFQQKMMHLDMLSYLPDDILTKVDRASMATSLEARVPLLDHRLIEFAWQLPMQYKLNGHQGKYIFREVLKRYIPEQLINRPKMGFGVPIEHWLKGPLRDWGESLIDESRLKNEGYLNAVPIRKMWEEHLSGTRRWHYYLWDVLMFQAWLENSQ
jgi:asparagine synthase (glutamine-hydrolysing)